MEKIKKLIFIFLGLMIILILSLVILYMYQKKEENSDETEKGNKGTSFEQYANTFKEVDNKNEYFAIKNIINKYFLYVQQINGDIFIDESKLQNSKTDTINNLKNEGINFIKDVLDDEYKKEFNISDEFILDDVKKFTKSSGKYDQIGISYNINIDKIYRIELIKDQNIFLVNALIDDKEFNSIIKLDWKNNTYSLFLDDYITKYHYTKDMNKNNIKISTNEIKATDNNKFSNNIIDDDTMAREYFSIQKNNILHNIKKEYELLDKQYSEKRFKNYDDFEEYAKEMEESLSTAYLIKYQVQHEDNRDIYNLIDSNNQFYSIIVSDSLLNYTVKLDDYTILTDDYINSYKKLSNRDKVFTNIEMFVKMINNKDYNSAYNVLDNTFKQNNFSNADEFKNYIKSNFFDISIIKSKANITKEGNYFICTVDLEDGSNLSETKKKSFVVALGEELDYSMSFNMD